MWGFFFLGGDEIKHQLNDILGRTVCVNAWGVKTFPGLTHSLVVGGLDDVQTFVLYTQTSFMGRTHTNPQAQIPSDQMLQLTGDRPGKHYWLSDAP